MDFLRRNWFRIVSPIFVIVLFLVAINLSEKETWYKCSGGLTRNNNVRGTETYMKLAEHGPWVSLWSDSHGSINLEIPNVWYEYYGYLEEVGDQILIYETFPAKKLRGNFSRLSKALGIDLGETLGFFDGFCSVSK